MKVKRDKGAKTRATKVRKREEEQLQRRGSPTPPSAKTEQQKQYAAMIHNGTIVFGCGPAGTGKTYMASALAAYALETGHISKIILTRPAIEAGEQLGFLPGDLDEKFDPWIAPFRGAFEERLGKAKFEYLLKTGAIEAIPLGYMRGRTFTDAWVLFDEAQNCTPSQMKMLLTRIGHNCKMIITGDADQSDLVDRKGARVINGLDDAVRRLKGCHYVQIMEFPLAAVVRSPVIAAILDRY